MEQRFSYVTRGGTAVMGIVAGLVLIGFCGYAVLNGWGINLYGAGLAPDIARWFYLFLIVLGAIVLILALVSRAAGAREVVVTADLLVLPRSEFSRAVVEIEPTQIRGLSTQRYNGVETLVVKHAHGTIRLRGPHFESLDAYLACVAAIEDARDGAEPHSSAR